MKIRNKSAATILSLGVLGAAAFASDEAQAKAYCFPGSCNNQGAIYETASGDVTSCATPCSEPQYSSSINFSAAFEGWYVAYQTNSYNATSFSGHPNGFGFTYQYSILCPGSTGWVYGNSNGTFYGPTATQYVFCPGFATGSEGFGGVTALAP